MSGVFKKEIWRAYDRQDHVDDPQWEHSRRIHDWRNYVGERTRALWDTFTPEQRMAIAADANDEAGNEHWD